MTEDAPSELSPVRVVIVDDQHLVRQGIQALLALSPHVTVIAEADDGHAGLAAIEGHHPDVVLLDLRMPRMSGLEMLRVAGMRGIDLPPGLQQAQQRDTPIFTPSTKAAVGDHDENIDFATAVDLVGRERAEQVRDATLALYAFARDYAATRGIILADTKFEFGTDADGKLYVMDEVLTPDSSRYWPADDYRVGTSPPSYDKQFVRDYLETLDWDKTPPGPRLPAEVIARTRAKYAEALDRLAGISVD